MSRRNGRLGLAISVSLTLGACPTEPTPDDTSVGASESDTTVGPSTTMGTTAAATDGSTGPGATGPGATGPGATGPGSTGPGTTGPDPMAEPTDCDTRREQGACEALSGLDFECVWFPNAYEVTLDGQSCTVGDAIGWCVAGGVGESGCVENISYTCMGDGAADFVFVREAADGTIVVIQDPNLANVEFGCFGPMLWDACDGGGPAACECACDPGVPQ